MAERTSSSAVVDVPPERVLGVAGDPGGHRHGVDVPLRGPRPRG